jgi:hypothetical protein
MRYGFWPLDQFETAISKIPDWHSFSKAQKDATCQFVGLVHQFARHLMPQFESI